MRRIEHAGLSTIIALATLLLPGVEKTFALAPHEVVVVVNQNSPQSKEIGNYYAERWGVPKRNLCYVDWPIGVMGWGQGWYGTGNSLGNAPNHTSVTARIKLPLDSFIASLGTEINGIILSWELPYVMHSSNGTQSVVNYLQTGRVMGGAPVNAYWSYLGSAYKESVFHQRMVFHLFGYDVAMMKSVIDRGVAGDGSFPKGTVYFQPSDKWTDTTSGDIQGLRYPNSKTVAPELIGMGLNARRDATSGDENFAPAATDLVGIVTGYGASYTPSKNYLYKQIKFFPGAIGEHLTSGGGRMDCWSDSWHFNCNEWISLGITATYGAVDEPGGTQVRFPHPKMYLGYAMGLSIGETYFGGVQDTCKGAFIGDPLSAPFARRPAVSLDLADGATITGSQAVNVAASTTRAIAGIGRICVYVDDLPLQTITGQTYRAGDAISFTAGSRTVNYTIPSGATQASVASGLSALINGDSSMPVTASASGSDFRGSVYVTHKVTGSTTNYGVAVTGDINAGTVSNKLIALTGSAAFGRVFFAPGKKTVTTSFALNSSTLGKGWHTLRVVAYDSSLQEIPGWKAQKFLVSSARVPQIVLQNGNPLPAHATCTLPMSVQVNASGFTSMAVAVNGQVVNQVSGNGPYPFNLNLSAIGDGPVELQAIGTDSTGARVRGPIQTVQMHSLNSIVAVWPWAGTGRGDTPWVAFSNAVDISSANISKIKLMSGGNEIACTRSVDAENRLVRLEPSTELPAAVCQLVVPTNFLDSFGLPCESKTHSWTPIDENRLMYKPETNACPWFTGNGDYNVLMPEWSGANGNMRFSGTVSPWPRGSDWSEAVAGQCYHQGPPMAPNGFSTYFQVLSYAGWNKFDVSANIMPASMGYAGYPSWSEIPGSGVRVGVGANALLIRTLTYDFSTKFYEVLFTTSTGEVRKANMTYHSNDCITVRIVSSGNRVDAYLNGALFGSSVETVKGGPLKLYAGKTGACDFFNVRVRSPKTGNATPTTAGQSISCAQGAFVTTTLTGADADGDLLSYFIVSQPQHGTVTVVNATATYVPATNYSGLDSFTFKVCDGLTSSAPAVVNIDVRPFDPDDQNANGMPDTWETQYFGSTTNQNGAAGADWDHDGHNNVNEYRAGTDPTDANSVLVIQQAAPASQGPAGLSISWQSVAGKLYKVEMATSLLQGFTVLTNGIAATPPLNTVTLVEQTANAFYRIGVE